MSLELTVRPREGGPREERCPYCHDAIDEARGTPDEARCDGCGTTHHLACVVELGRCTVMGCERPLAAGGVEAPEPERDPGRSRVWRDVQRRVRARAREFVLAHCRSPVIEPAELRRLLGSVLDQAELAMARGEWLAAEELWGEAARLETLAKPGDLDGAPRRVDPERARAIAAALGALPRRERRLYATVAAVVLVALMINLLRDFFAG